MKLTKSNNWTFAALIAVLSMSANPLIAAITTFSDRALFESAISSLAGTRSDENFDIFTADTSYASGPISLNGFSVSAFGSASSTAYLIDASPFSSSGKQQVNGTSYLKGNNLSTTRGYQFLFDQEIFAFGFDVDDVENSSTSLQLSDGTAFDLQNGFRGFISDIPITFGRSTGGGSGDSVGFDDFITVAVPERSSAALLLGFFTLALVSQYRRK